jgi:aarF domain-containing kinase
MEPPFPHSVDRLPLSQGCCIARASTTDTYHCCLSFCRAFAALDGANVAQWTLRFSGTEQACEDPQAFVEDMETTFETLKKTIAANQAAEAHWKEQQRQQRKLHKQQQQQAVVAAAIEPQQQDDTGSSSSTTLIPMPEHFDSGAEALSTVLELVRVHGVSLPGHICAVVVTTLILEGWSNKLAPDHSVLSQVQGMFSPAMYRWHDRIDSVVDMVMDRGDTALLLA